MAWTFFSRVFGPTTPQARDPDDAEIEALIVDWSLRLPDQARTELRGDLDILRDARGRDRRAALAALFCRVEDHLTATATGDPQSFRSQFREQMRRHWPRLAALDEMSLVLLPPDRQEAALCGAFLQSAARNARQMLGAAAGNKLGELRLWLEAGLARGEPCPFSSRPAAEGEQAATPISALLDCSRGFYAWLYRVLGARADAIFENAYRQIARQYGAAEGFPLVLGMLPDRLLTADKLSLLRRNQIENVLKEKVEQLERANAAIRDAHDMLEQRVGERTRELEIANRELSDSLKALAEAKQQADAASRAKSAFLANISHELRTPLNAIIGFSQMMTEASLRHIAGERYPEYARHIYDSGAHLLDIINEILDTSKLEAGRQELYEENVRIDQIVDASLTTLRARIEKAGHRIERAVEPALPDVLADRRMLTQMLLNLLGNAVKFTEPGGSIRIEARINDQGGLDLAVHDTGIGIAEADIPLVLEPFRQVRNAYLRDKGGTGLGLPLVVGMARLHGGDFVLRSTLGAGTSAIIRLPPERLMRPQAGAPPA